MLVLRVLPVCLLASLAGCTGAEVDDLAEPADADALINGALDAQHKQVGKVVHRATATTASMCTGTLIGTHTVLTAGHCVDEEGAIAGPDKMSFDLDGTVHRVRLVSRHPAYDRTKLPAADLAILVLVDDIPDVQPLRLATVAPARGERLVLVGFGRVTANQPGDGKRRTGQNTVERVFGTGFAMLGASGPDSGICYGDSGGPSLAVRGATMAVAGVHSTASCDTRATVAGVDPNESNDTRVDAYLDYIKRVAGDDLYLGGAYEQAAPTITMSRVVEGGGGDRARVAEGLRLRIVAADDQELDRVVLFVNGVNVKTVPLGRASYSDELVLANPARRPDGTVWIQAAAIDRAARRTNTDLVF